MRIRRLTLEAADLAGLRAFYAEALGLEVVRATAEALELRAGWTTLRFEHAPGGGPAPYHFAFNIPPDAMDHAEPWLAERATLLREGGRGRFDFPAWEAQAIYAADPAGNIIELIARRRLAARLGDRSFSSKALQCVSEIGVVVDDPTRAARELCASLGLSIFSDATPDFAAVGDDEGLLIVVLPDRPWKPTEDAMSRPARTAVELEGPGGGAPDHAAWAFPPYTIRRS